MPLAEARFGFRKRPPLDGISALAQAVLLPAARDGTPGATSL